ncbi:MAG: hypothetical protein AAGA58_11520 [Verrucomicrobiota bacterium]
MHANDFFLSGLPLRFRFAAVLIAGLFPLGVSASIDISISGVPGEGQSILTISGTWTDFSQEQVRNGGLTERTAINYLVSSANDQDQSRLEVQSDITNPAIPPTGDFDLYVSSLTLTSKPSTTPLFLPSGPDFDGTNFLSANLPFMLSVLADDDGAEPFGSDNGELTISLPVGGVPPAVLNIPTQSVALSLDIPRLNTGTWVWQENGGSQTVTLTISQLPAPVQTQIADIGGDWVGTATLPAKWQYLQSDMPNGGIESALAGGGQIGNAGNSGFGGGQDGFNLGAVTGVGPIFVDGTTNNLISGTDLAVHPADGTKYVILRRTITAGDLANGTGATITGSFRNLINNGNSIDALVYRNNTPLFTVFATGPTLSQTEGTFDISTTVGENDVIDFVVGDRISFSGDETAIRGTITLAPPSRTFTFNGAINNDLLNPGNWSTPNGDTATPHNIATLDTYLLASNATLSSSMVLQGDLIISGGVTLTVATTGAIAQTGGSDLGGAGLISNFGTVVLDSAGIETDPTTLTTEFINQVGARFTRIATSSSSSSSYSIIGQGGTFLNHGIYTDETGSRRARWEVSNFTNSATGNATIRTGSEATSWTIVNQGTLTFPTGIRSNFATNTTLNNAGTLNAPSGITNGNRERVINSGIINLGSGIFSLNNTPSGILNLTSDTFFALNNSSEAFVNDGVINQGPHKVSITSYSITTNGTWNSNGPIEIGEAISLPIVSELKIGGGTLTNDGSWNLVGNTANISLEVRGTLAGSAPLDIPAGARFALDGGTIANSTTTSANIIVLSSATLCTVSGILALRDGADFPGSYVLNVTGLLATMGTGTSTCSGAIQLSNPNQDVLNIENGTTLITSEVFYSAGIATVNGTWDHDTTALCIDEQPYLDSVVKGTGTIDASQVKVFGRFEPGPDNGIGAFNFTGAVTLEASSETEIEVFSSSSFDKISGLTSLTFNGGKVIADFTRRPLADPATYTFITGSPPFTVSSSPTSQSLGLHPNRNFNLQFLQFTIDAGTATAYDDWAVESGLTQGLNAGFMDDPNKDGKTNLEHFGDDTNPLGSGGSEGKQKVLVTNIDAGNFLTLTRPIRRGAIFSGFPTLTSTVDGITYRFSGDTDLSKPYDLGVVASNVTLFAGLPPLRDIDGDGLPDWEYRTLRLAVSSPPLNRGYILQAVASAP